MFSSAVSCRREHVLGERGERLHRHVFSCLWEEIDPLSQVRLFVTGDAYDTDGDFGSHGQKQKCGAVSAPVSGKEKDHEAYLDCHWNCAAGCRFPGKRTGGAGGRTGELAEPRWRHAGYLRRVSILKPGPIIRRGSLFCSAATKAPCI